MQLTVENESFDSEVDDLIFLSLSGRKVGNNNLLRDFCNLQLKRESQDAFTFTY